MSKQSFAADPRTFEQGGELWKRARIGRVTASNIADVMAKGKSGEAIGRYKYKVKIVAERITGVAQESFSNAAMEWGVEQEPFAAMAYDVSRETMSERTGLWVHPDINWLGASPDRLVGEDGLLEIKCPNTTTHLTNIFENRVPSEYIKQIQCQLWVTGRQWCDFVSFDPRVGKRNELFVCRVQRDDSLIETMRTEVLQFLSEVDSLVNQLESNHE
jgi:putative phage-type endonuclease